MAYVIDCDKDPFIPEGWTVVEHKKMGQLEWDPTRIRFYLSKKQMKGKHHIEGNKLRKELASMPVLNANVLDSLLARPGLIPEEWKKDENGNARFVFFWGTIYRDSADRLRVRSLHFDDTQWVWRHYWLGLVFYISDSAALLA